MNDQNQNQALVPLLLKANDAAKMLAISPRKLWTLTNCGEIRCVRIGGAVRYDPADLRSFIEKHKRKSTLTQHLA